MQHRSSKKHLASKITNVLVGSISGLKLLRTIKGQRQLLTTCHLLNTSVTKQRTTLFQY